MILEPPAHYVHPYPGYLRVEVMRTDEIDARCRAYGAKSERSILACSLRLGTAACLIVIPPETRAFHHELAHCHGWRHR